MLRPATIAALGPDLIPFIENAIYTPMSDHQKIAAIYSVFDEDPKKTMMKTIIQKYEHELYVIFWYIIPILLQLIIYTVYV